VKVFAQKDGGNSIFYRDGYTDIRGRFEYAQSSGNKSKGVQKFAILIMSDEFGSLIKECNPPNSAGGAGEEFGISSLKMNRLMNQQQQQQHKPSFMAKKAVKM